LGHQLQNRQARRNPPGPAGRVRHRFWVSQRKIELSAENAQWAPTAAISDKRLQTRADTFQITTGNSRAGDRSTLSSIQEFDCHDDNGKGTKNH
jgi:hypothetical protein